MSVVMIFEKAVQNRTEYIITDGYDRIVLYEQPSDEEARKLINAPKDIVVARVPAARIPRQRKEERKMKHRLAERIAKQIGVNSGPNTFYGPDITYPYNHGIYISVVPLKLSKSLGYIQWRDLVGIIKVRLWCLFTRTRLYH